MSDEFSIRSFNDFFNGAMSPLTSIRAPISYSEPSSANQAWHAWLGSHQATAALIDQLLRIKIPGHFSRFSELRKLPPGMIISTMLMMEGNFRLISESIGDGPASDIHPQSALEIKIKDFLGVASYEEILSFVAQSSPVQILCAVREAIPQVGELFEVGGFSRKLAIVSLVLRKLLNLDDLEQGSKSRRFVVDMLLHLLVEKIDVPIIKTCVVHANPRIKRIYRVKSLHDGLCVESPVFGSSLNWTQEIVASCAVDSVRERFASPEISFHLDMINGYLLATQKQSRLFMAGMAEALKVCAAKWKATRGALLDVPMTDVARATISGLLPPRLFSDMVSPDQIRYDHLDCIHDFTSQFNDLADRLSSQQSIVSLSESIEAVRAEISEVTSKLDMKDFDRLRSLGETGSALVARMDSLVAVSVDKMSEIAALASRFGETWKALTDTADQAPAPPASLDPLDSLCQQAVDSAPQPSHVAADGVTKSASRDESQCSSTSEDALLDALTRNEQLAMELKAARAEVHRVNLALNASSERRASQAVADVSQVLSQLSRKVLFGERLTPIEILEYIGLLAGDRIVFLDSALKSARASEHFAYCDKLLDMLKKLAFPFLDSVRAGEPEIKAALSSFAGAYSSKESQTVSATARMRAQREFVYDGERIFFESRLKVSNGWGPVEGMRVYFEVLGGRVVVAYVGEHMEVESTN